MRKGYTNMHARNIRCLGGFVVLATCLTASRTQAGGQHAGDLIVGRDGAGKLKIEFDFTAATSLMPVSGVLNGWSDADPGFEALKTDEPGEDFFTLQTGASIVFEVISFQPAFKAYSPGFATVLDGPGDTWTIGGSNLHEHPTWHIDSDDPGFVPSQTEWQGTFRLVDQGNTGYDPSDPYTIRFTSVPPVPSLSPWGVALLALCLLSAGGGVLYRRGFFETPAPRLVTAARG